MTFNLFSEMERELSGIGKPVTLGPHMTVPASYWLDRMGNLTRCGKEHRDGVEAAWRSVAEKHHESGERVSLISKKSKTREVMAETIAGGLVRIRLTSPSRTHLHVAVERPDGELTPGQRRVLLDMAAMFPDAYVDAETPRSLLHEVKLRSPVGWDAAIEGGLALYRT